MTTALITICYKISQTGELQTPCTQKLVIVKDGKLQKSDSSLICVIIAEGSTNALPVFTSIFALYSSLLAQQECPSSVSDQWHPVAGRRVLPFRCHHRSKPHQGFTRTLFNWTKQGKMCEFSRKLSFSKLCTTATTITTTTTTTTTTTYLLPVGFLRKEDGTELTHRMDDVKK